MHQLTKDVLFLVEFSGGLDPDKLNKLVDNTLDRAYYEGYSNGAEDQIRIFQYRDIGQ